VNLLPDTSRNELLNLLDTPQPTGHGQAMFIKKESLAILPKKEKMPPNPASKKVQTLDGLLCLKYIKLMSRSLNPVERKVQTLLLETASGFKVLQRISFLGENPSRGVIF
jgi:hypothetical protein